MSTQIFPSNIPGIDIKVERATEYVTKILTSESGREQRIAYQSVPRYRYTLTFNFLRTAKYLPAPNATETETGLVQRFHDDHLGSWDSFLFSDPYSGTQVRVRFASDTLAFERLVSGAWVVKKLQMIQVL